MHGQRIQIDKWTFYVIEYIRLTDRISDSSWQLTFTKLLLVKFWCSIKLSEKTMNIRLVLPNRNLHEAKFSSCTPATTTKIYHNRLKAKADFSISCFILSHTLKTVCKNINASTLLSNFFGGKYTYFPLKYIVYITQKFIL